MNYTNELVLLVRSQQFTVILYTLPYIYIYI